MWQLKKTVVLLVILAVLATIWAAPAEKKCKCKGKVISPSEQTSLLSHMVEMLSKLIRHQKEHICLTSTDSEIYDISVCNSTGSEEDETCQSPVVNTTTKVSINGTPVPISSEDFSHFPPINEDVSLAKPTNPTEGYVTLSSVETETMNPVQEFSKEDPTVTKQPPNDQDGTRRPSALNENIFEPSEDVTTFRYEEDVTKSKHSSYDQKITSFSEDVSEPDEENVTLDPVDNLTGHPNNKEETATFKPTEDDVTELPDHEEAVTIIDSGLKESNSNGNTNTTPQLHDNQDKIASNTNSFKSTEDHILKPEDVTELPDYEEAIAIIDLDESPTSTKPNYEEFTKNTIILNSKDDVTEDIHSQDLLVNEDLSVPTEVITWRPEDNGGINKNHSSAEDATTSIYSDEIVSGTEDPIYKKAASESDPFSPKEDVTVNIHFIDYEITTPGYFVLNENTFKPIDEYVTIRSAADVYNYEEDPQSYEDRTRVPSTWSESTPQPTQNYNKNDLTTEYFNYEEANTPNEDSVILNPTENVHLQSDYVGYVTLKPEVGVTISDNPNFDEESTSDSTEVIILETITKNPIYEEETGTAVYFNENISTEATTVNIESHSDESPLVFSENTAKPSEGFITLRPEDEQIINDPNSGLEKTNLEDSTPKILLNPQEGVTETVRLPEIEFTPSIFENEERPTTGLTILSDNTSLEPENVVQFTTEPNGNSKNNSKFITNEESGTKPEGFEYFTLPSVEQSVPNSDSKIFESGPIRITTRNPPLQSASPQSNKTKENIAVEEPEGSGDGNTVKGKPYIKVV